MSTETSPPSKYHFTERPDSFTITADIPNRTPVTVTLEPSRFVVAIEEGEVEIGLYELERIKKTIVFCIMKDWTAPENAPRHEDGTPKWRMGGDWARGRTYRALSRRIHDQWQRLTAKADPDVLAVHRTAYAAMRRSPEILLDPALYGERWLVADLGQYRAAIIAAANVVDLARQHNRRRLLNSPEALELQRQAQALGLRLDFDPALTGPYRETFTLENAIAALGNWRGLFSPTGEPYRSLDRTLMNLPGGIPPSLIPWLQTLRLRRPYTQRLELMALLLYAERIRQSAAYGRAPRTENPANLSVIERATADQIKRAVAHVGAHLRRPLSHRKAQDVRDAILFLADYPEPHHGNIVGLADRAILWHRDQQEAERRTITDRLGAETQTALPPVPLPELPGIRFLETVGEVVEEGAIMDHCVATYAPRAVGGFAYLFHVENAGDHATVEVDRHGRVIQAQGPRNGANQAAIYGRQALGIWGAMIADQTPVIRGALPPGARYGEEEIPF